MKVRHEWYATLFAPEFRFQAALQGKDRARPHALCETQGRKPRVIECNGAARAQNVVPGMTQVQALARCPGLKFLESHPEQEKAAQQVLIAAAEDVSPYVESTSLGIVTLALPCEGNWAETELENKLVRPLHQRGWLVTVGAAQNPDLALLAARFAQPVRRIDAPEEFLAPLLLAVLQPSAECLSVLESWGIRTIGQLIALPHAEVCERLGPEAVELWERATGAHQRALRWLREQDAFIERIELEHPVEMLEPLLFLVRRFLEQITLRLARIYMVPGQLRLVLFFADGKPYEHVFSIPEPTGDVAVLFRILHTHLDGFTSEWPIVGLELIALPARASSEQRDLFAQGLRDPQRFAETLSRLQALLGAEQVGRAQLEPSYNPEAFHLLPYMATEPSDFEARDPALEGVVWLRFRPPIPVEPVFKDDQPIFINSAICNGSIREALGPWYQEGTWWQPQPWSREEWDVAMEDGALYRLVRLATGWILEGQYV
jgi:protein ImuB